MESKKEPYENAQLITGNCSAKTPDITIAIPTYKRAEYLKIAIESALNQTGYRKSYEVIVVDNEDQIEGLSDTEQVIRGFDDDKLLYYRNVRNLGMIGNWNQCLRLARGRWVAFLHDDDYLDVNYLARMEVYLSKLKDVKCIIPNHRDVDSAGKLLPKNRMNRRNAKWVMRLHKDGLMKVSDMDDKLLAFNHYGCPSCGLLLDKKAALRAGGYNSEYKWLSDWEFYLRIRKLYPIYKTREILASYRWSVNESLNKSGDRLKEIMREHKNVISFSFSLLPYKSERKRKVLRDVQKEAVNLKYKVIFRARKIPNDIPPVKFNMLCKICLLAVTRSVYMYFRELFN